MNGVAKIVRDDGMRPSSSGGYTQRRILTLTPHPKTYGRIILLCKVENGRSSFVAYPCSDDDEQLTESYIKVIKHVGMVTYLNHIGYRLVFEEPTTHVAKLVSHENLTDSTKVSTYRVEPALIVEEKPVTDIRVVFEKQPHCASVTHAYDATLPPADAHPIPGISGIGWDTPSQALRSAGIEEREDEPSVTSESGDGEVLRRLEARPSDIPPKPLTQATHSIGQPPHSSNPTPISLLVPELARQNERIKDIETLSGLDQDWTAPLDPGAGNCDFIAWTADHVYFTVLDDGIQFDSVPRNPHPTPSK